MPKRRSSADPKGSYAINSCGDGFWEIDLSDGSAWFSDWFYREFDWKTRDFRPTWASLNELIPAPGWDQLLRAMRQHLETDAPLDLDVAHPRPTGELAWLNFRGKADRNLQGMPLRLSGSVRDVSAERQLRERLREDLARLQSAFSALPIAAALLDADGVILSVTRDWLARIANIPSLREVAGVGGVYAQFLAACGQDDAQFEHRLIGNDSADSVLIWHPSGHGAASPEIS